MSELSSEMKSTDNEEKNGFTGGTFGRRRNRAQNVWSGTAGFGGSAGGGGFGGTAGGGFFGNSEGEQEKKVDGLFGGGSGFGGRPDPTASGFGGTHHLASSLRFPKTSSSRQTVSDPLQVDKDRRVTSSPSENVTGSPRVYPRGRGNENNGRARRSGRRQREKGPGHCFHCQEQGHISRMCPQKIGMADGGFGSGAGDAAKKESSGDSAKRGYGAFGDPVGPPPKIIDPFAGKGDSSFQSAKLEHQKARESYYGVSLSSPAVNKNSTSSESKVAGFGAPPPSAPEMDRFSEQLDNALKFVESKNDNNNENNGKSGGMAIEKIPSKEAGPGHETVTIETRRSVKKDGKCEFEETTVITFPRHLPPNVRVITAQFVPTISAN